MVMNDGRTIFSQLIFFLPDREFRRSVARYRAILACVTVLLGAVSGMAFAQLTYARVCATSKLSPRVGRETLSSRLSPHGCALDAPPQRRRPVAGTQWARGERDLERAVVDAGDGVAPRSGMDADGEGAAVGMSRIARVELNRPRQRSSSTHRERWCRLDEVDVL